MVSKHGIVAQYQRNTSIQRYYFLPNSPKDHNSLSTIRSMALIMPSRVDFMSSIAFSITSICLSSDFNRAFMATIEATANELSFRFGVMKLGRNRFISFLTPFKPKLFLKRLLQFFTKTTIFARPTRARIIVVTSFRDV